MSKSENYFYNQYRIEADGKTVIGVLSNGYEFKIDIEDLPKITEYKWYPSGRCVSNRTCMNRNGQYIHRYIMNEPNGFEVDHINMDRMNNCRSNLRICNHQQNQCNQPLQSNNTSGFTGVRFYKARNKYVARIKFYGKDIHLGYYYKLIEAIQARNFGAKLLFGEFAVSDDVPEAPEYIKNFIYQKCKIYIQKKQTAI